MSLLWYSDWVRNLYVRAALRRLDDILLTPQVLEGGPGVPWRQLAMYALQSEMQRLQARCHTSSRREYCAVPST